MTDPLVREPGSPEEEEARWLRGPGDEELYEIEAMAAWDEEPVAPAATDLADSPPDTKEEEVSDIQNETIEPEAAAGYSVLLTVYPEAETSTMTVTAGAAGTRTFELHASATREIVATVTQVAGAVTLQQALREAGVIESGEVAA